MGYGADAPPAPDYTPIANASAESARIAGQTAADQLAWAKETYAKDSATTGKVVDSLLKTMDTNATTAAEDRKRYSEKFQPLEDKLISDADSYGSPERKDLEMGRSQAAVGQQFDAARTSATKNLESYGIDPSSTRYAALDVGMRAQRAASEAAAGNQTSQAVDATGRALRSEAINVGRGYPGQIAGQYATSMQAGTSAENSTLANTATGANTMGTGTQWSGVQNAGLNTSANALNMGYNNKIAGYNAEANSSNGIGSSLALLGVGAMKYGPAMAAMMADGGAVDASQTPGGAIPVQASPSGGAGVDDVAAQLTAGEFVLPKDVMQWKGEEWAQKEIQKAREAKQGAVAKPAVGVAPQQRPTFVSRPGQGAVPMG